MAEMADFHLSVPTSALRKLHCSVRIYVLWVGPHPVGVFIWCAALPCSCQAVFVYMGAVWDRRMRGEMASASVVQTSQLSHEQSRHMTAKHACAA